ncbi:LVIVD repeat-containing protein [Bacteroidota bacterium]
MKNLFMFIFIMSLIIAGCEGYYFEDTSDTGGAEHGVGGSLARFTIANDYLYAVDDDELKILNIENPETPEFVKEIQVGFGIETIFIRERLLFLGSRFGMYIFDISSPRNPVQLSNYQHIYSCDPVVADDEYAYVTLSTSTNCGRNTNELQIVSIKDPSSPYLVKNYSMSNPLGLGIKDDILFLCDDGLKIYNISDVLNINLIQKFSIAANDVIPLDNHLLVIGDDGLYNYQYQNDSLKFLSKIITYSNE